jgi:hypothetical protein
MRTLLAIARSPLSRKQQKRRDDGITHFTKKRKSPYLAKPTQSARWPWAFQLLVLRRNGRRLSPQQRLAVFDIQRQQSGCKRRRFLRGVGLRRWSASVFHDP